MSGREQLLERMWKREDEIGNHSWSHPFLTGLSNDGVRRELRRTDRAIKRAVKPVGGGEPDLFRPPYGDVDGRVRDIARAKGMRTVLWDVDPADYTRPGTSTIVSRVVTGVGSRSIIQLHDGPEHRSQTVRAVPKIIHRLRDRNFSFVTVSELLAGQSKRSAGATDEQQPPTEPPDAFGRPAAKGGG